MVVRQACEERKWPLVRKKGNLDHQLLIGDIMGAFYRSAREVGATITDQSELPGVPTQFKTVYDLETVEVWPDRIFRLNFPNGKQLHFALEADTGHMPVAQVSNTPQRSLQQKALKYLAIQELMFKEAPYGFKGFAVLFVTKPTRAGNVSSRYRRCCKHSNMRRGIVLNSF